MHIDRIADITDAAVITRLAESVVAARSLEQLVRPLLEMLEAISGLESTYMTTIDEAAGVQHILYARNTKRLQIPEGLSVPWNDTLCKRALQEGRMYTDDVAGCWGDSDAARALGIQTYASTPIHGTGGSLHGTLCAASGDRRPLQEGADRVMRLFAHLIGQQVEREQLLQALQAANRRLSQTALTDPVTGLPNRRALLAELERRLSHRRRDGSRVLVAFIDLDDFKQINDAHGHEVGDRFLAAIADALSHSHRADDFCARLGGDEFVVVGTTGHETDADADADSGERVLLTRLRAATQGRFDVGGLALDYGGTSIGVITAGEEEDATAALARADAAMYADKRARKALGGGH